MPKFKIYEEDGIKYKEENGNIYKLNRNVWVLWKSKTKVKIPKIDRIDYRNLSKYSKDELREFGALLKSYRSKLYTKAQRSREVPDWQEYHKAAMHYHLVMFYLN